MKSSRMKIAAVLLMAAVALTGCGETLYVLTPEEEAAIVSYAAHTVAKFNSYQKDGQVFVSQKDLEETEQETEPEVNTESAETETEDTEQTEQNQSKPDNSQVPADDAGASSSTLTEALDLGVVKAECTGTELCSSYQESDFYAVDADAGKQFLVVHVDLVNQSTQDLHIDILAMTPTFRAVVNGTETVPAQTTILLDDLGTYQADIAAKATNEAVLLFQIPEEIEEISSLQMKVTMSGNSYTIDL